MTVRHMRIFVRVYETRSITKAAEELHMTQPGVSRTIQEIERHYGVRLFERINHRLSVTEVGKQLYQQALHIVASFDTLEQGLYNWDSFGILRIGATISIGTCRLPGFLVEFKKQHPNVRVESKIFNGGRLQSALMENKLDLALIENTIQDPNLVSIPFSRDEMLLITPADHPILKAPDDPTLSELLRYDFYMREDGSVSRSFVESIFIAADLAVRPASVSVSTQAIIHAVSAGLGISILPKDLVQGDIDRGNIGTRKIAGVNLTRTNNIVRHKNKFLSPALKNFIDICMQ